MNNLIPAKLKHLPSRDVEVAGDEITVCRHVYRHGNGWRMRYQDYEGWFSDAVYGSADNSARAAMVDLAELYDGRAIGFKNVEWQRKRIKIGVGLHLIYTKGSYRIVVTSPGPGVPASRMMPDVTREGSIAKALTERDRMRREYTRLVHKEERQLMEENIRKDKQIVAPKNYRGTHALMSGRQVPFSATNTLH